MVAAACSTLPAGASQSSADGDAETAFSDTDRAGLRVSAPPGADSDHATDPRGRPFPRPNPPDPGDPDRPGPGPAPDDPTDNDLANLAVDVMTANPSPAVWTDDPERFSTPTGNPGTNRYLAAAVDDPLVWPFLEILSGARGGFDVFMSVRTEQDRPGAGEVDLWHGTDWVVPEDLYGVGSGDEPGDYYILGDSRVPYYAGKTSADDADRDLVYIVNSGREFTGSIFRLHGSPDDYALVDVADPGAPPDPALNPPQPSPWPGVALFYVKDGINDMIAHFDNATLDLFDLDNPEQFVFDTGVDPEPTLAAGQGGFAQTGGDGVEGWGGWVATDEAGNVYQLGMSSSVAENVPGGDTGSFLLSKYDADGNRLWVRRHGTDPVTEGAGELPYAIHATDDAVFVTGGTKGPYGGPAPELSSENGQHPFVAKFDAATGDELVVRQLWSGEGVNANTWSVGGAGDGYILVGGGVSAPGINPNDLPLPDTSPFLQKLRADDLSEVWSEVVFDGRLFGGGTDELGLAQVSQETIGGIDYTPNPSGQGGTVYISGYTVAGPFCGNNIGTTGAFTVRIDDTGDDASVAWCHAFGAELDHQYAYRTRTDSAGNVYVAGQTNGSIDGEDYSGGGDGFVRKFDPDGNTVWTRLFGGSHSDVAYGMTIVNDRIFVTGTTWSDDFAGPTAGLSDTFLIEMSTDGEVAGKPQLLGTEWFDFSVDLVSAGNTLYLGGMTEGSLTGRHAGPGGTDHYIISACVNPQGWNLC